MNDRPNIVWLSLEDTSPRLGCYGDAVARTPNVDRIAREGCIYPNAFATAGVCAPSRFSIITGIYATAAGAHHMRTRTHEGVPGLPPPYEVVTPPPVRCFTEYLRAAGYYCTNNDKTDYQFSPPGTAWDECSRNAHWRSREAGQPFFAVFNFIVTHESGMWPKEGERIKTDPQKVALPPYLPDTPKSRLALARHYDNIAAADARVGEVVSQLEEDGLLERTIIVVWSDHGEGLPRAKRWPYDAGIRVPMIVRWPGVVRPGTRNDRLVSVVDLGPTALSMAGLGVPRHLHGRPFVGPAEVEREYVFATRDRYDESYDRVRAVRDGRFKYIRHDHVELPYLLWIPYSFRHPAMQELWRLHLAGELNEAQQALFRPRPPEELYDTEKDPWELRNLADNAEHAATLQRLRGALRAWQDEFGDLGDEPEEQMVERMWPGMKQPQTSRPVAIAIGPDREGQEIAGEKERCRGPLLVQLYCGTQGASMEWTVEQSEKPRWRIYTGPIRLERDTIRLRARAYRIGYRPSEEMGVEFEVL